MFECGPSSTSGILVHRTTTTGMRTEGVYNPPHENESNLTLELARGFPRVNLNPKIVHAVRFTSMLRQLCAATYLVLSSLVHRENSYFRMLHASHFSIRYRFREILTQNSNEYDKIKSKPLQMFPLRSSITNFYDNYKINVCSIPIST